jgi:hypothetical protein
MESALDQIINDQSSELDELNSQHSHFPCGAKKWPSHWVIPRWCEDPLKPDSKRYMKTKLLGNHLADIRIFGWYKFGCQMSRYDQI